MTRDGPPRTFDPDDEGAGVDAEFDDLDEWPLGDALGVELPSLTPEG